MSCIVRIPLLDPQQKVLGYKLAWPARPGRPGDLRSLAAWVARKPQGDHAGWLARDAIVFLQAAPGALSPDMLAGLPPAKTVVSLAASELHDPERMSAAKALRDRGYGVSMREPRPADLSPELLPLLTHVEVAGPFELRAPHPLRVVGTQLGSVQDWRACAGRGLDAFVGDLHVVAGAAGAPGRLNPASLLILQVMQLVQANADVRELETALKRDAALAYRLLRYLNSASFGLGVEVQSLRHAVTMLGYRPLLRWLAVLLAASRDQGSSPVLMQSALVRGRFVEYLGQGLLPKGDAENLFLVGMFSLLDRLLGVPIGEVLEKVPLAGPVVQALLTRDGVYGPFLRLAEACEGEGGDPAGLADDAFLTSEQVNRAHLAALDWACELQA